MLNPFKFLFPNKNGQEEEQPVKSDTKPYTKEEYEESKKKREEGIQQVRNLSKEISDNTQTFIQQNGIDS